MRMSSLGQLALGLFVSFSLAGQALAQSGEEPAPPSEDAPLEPPPPAESYIDVNSRGPDASATGLNAIAIGEGATASGDGAISIGARANSGFDNSVALGPGARTQRQNQIMLGTRASTYSLPGVTSPGSQAQQTGDLELLTTDANGNIASDNGRTVAQLTAQIANNGELISDNTANINDVSRVSQAHDTVIAANQSAIQANADSIGSLEDTVDANTAGIDQLKAGQAGDSNRIAAIETSMAKYEMAFVDNTEAISGLQLEMDALQALIDQHSSALHRQSAEIDENTVGIAIANALAGSTWLQSNERAAISMNLGYFDGNTALALSGAARLHERWTANVAVGSVPSRGDIGARAGLRVGW